MTTCSTGLPISRRSTLPPGAPSGASARNRAPPVFSPTSNPLTLERQLRDGSYRPGRYTVIEVLDPKKRLVSAAPFRDRVVHHALCAVVCPILEAGFIGNTFANRIGKGTHRAIKTYERYRDRHSHVLRCDIFRYFPSIDHAILKAAFRRRIACGGTLALMDMIIDGSNRQEPVNLYFDGDDLFAPYERRRGLPIGNSSPISISTASIIT
jgi:RNA-directed DNA polymerase